MANKYTNIDLSKYNNGYQASDAVNKALAQKNEAENAVKNYGDFSFSKQGISDDLINKILNRNKFSYDLNGDALYQQYKDKYVQQGKLAMADTIGQASAMTGGYGNSYATTAGNQAYQASLQNLNDIVPQLYQLALDQYNQEGQDLYNQKGMLDTEYSKEKEAYDSAYNRLVANRDYYGNAYDSAYNKDYTEWNDNRTYDTSQYWNEYNSGYQAERDRISDEQWQKNYKLEQAQLAAQKESNNQSSTIASLNAELEALKDQYSGYISPEIQKAGNSEAVKTFKASVLTSSELKLRKNTTNINGESKRFDNYNQYIDSVLERWYENGRLTENEVAYLKGYYGIG